MQFCTNGHVIQGNFCRICGAPSAGERPPAEAPAAAAEAPVTTPPPAPEKKPNWFAAHKVATGILAVVAVITIASLASNTPTNDTTATKNEPTQPAVDNKPAPARPSFDFEDGDFLVGSEVKPGTYRAAAPDQCYWARLKGLGGEVDDIIANENTTAPTIVTIGAKDKGFKSEGCGGWTHVIKRITSSTTKFGEGTYVVRLDIAPGLYRSEEAPEGACYWARLKSLGGTPEEIIANDNVEHRATVRIAATDKGFKSEGCGSWTKIG